MKPKLLLFVLMLPVLTAAQTYTYSTLVSFPPASQLGPLWPGAPLLMDADGNLYSTTLYGGTYGTATGGYGTLFKVTPQGVMKVLHDFGNGTDGQVPIGNIAMDASGNIYGTTYVGGQDGVGTVYKVTPGGDEAVLYNFGFHGLFYNLPNGGVTLDAAGNLYGYFYQQGNNFISDGGDIFKVTPQGVFSTVYTWCLDGQQCFKRTGTNGPVGVLTRNKEGEFFGVTVGINNNFPGTVFKVPPKGGMSLLYTFNFDSGTAGPPLGISAPDAKGNLFGIGTNGVFEVAADGTESVLYLFPARSNPYQTPMLDSNDNVYGTTESGGANGLGSVYMVSPSGQESTLWSATSSSPVQGDSIVMDKAGNLYGACFQCGTNGTGSIYKLTKNVN
jgi:uncharacterized repeat protein (TIGR03803 family)